MILTAYRKRLMETVHDDEVKQLAISILNSMSEEIETARRKITEIESSDLFSSKGKSVKISEIKAELAETLNGMKRRNKLARLQERRLAERQAQVDKLLKFDEKKIPLYSEIRQRVLAENRDSMRLESTLLTAAMQGKADVICAFLHDPLEEVPPKTMDKIVNRIAPPVPNDDLTEAVEILNIVVDAHTVQPEDLVSKIAHGGDKND